MWIRLKLPQFIGHVVFSRANAFGMALTMGNFTTFLLSKSFKILPKFSFNLLLCKVKFYQDGI